MTILYSLISRGTVVLVEYTGTSGNFPTITRVLLGKITLEDGRMSYIYDQYVFHYIIENNIIYLCLCDDSNKRRLPFNFLDDIKDRFLNKFGNQAQQAIAYSFTQQFSPILRERMEYFNGPGGDSFSAVNNKIEDVKNVMVRNIELVLERGEKLEILVDKAEALSTEAFKFESQSKRLKYAMWWRRIKLYVMIFVVLAVIIIIIIIIAAVICKGNFKTCNN
jgi:vesicle-associated membrane protein 7